jgi:hypothetical protein
VFDLLASVQSGFPSAAEDIGARRIDHMERLIKHPRATCLTDRVQA